MPERIKGHYVGKFHLKEFTTARDPHGRLHVVDKARATTWASSPINSAKRLDMYVLDAGVPDRQAVEKAFSTVEERFATGLRTTVEQRKLPEGAEWDVMLNLVAFTAARVPSFQNAMNGVTDHALKSIARQAFSGEQGWRRFQETVRAAGGNTDKLDPQTFAVFIASDDYTITLSQTGYIQVLVDSVGVILETLAARQWNLWTASEDAPDLICSDSPVSVAMTAPNTGQYGVGFGTPNTVLTMPLGRRLLLVGAFEGRPASRVMDRSMVAAVNSLTASNANQLYSPEPDFVWRTPGGQIGGAADMFAWLRDGNARRAQHASARIAAALRLE